MKQAHTPARRAAWLFLAAPALLAIPAHAQDATQEAPTPPPPVSVTVPQAQTPAPKTATTSVKGTDPSSRTTIAPGAADVVDEARVAARTERRVAPPREPRRAATASRATAPAAAAVTTAGTTAPTPAPAAPVTTPAETATTPAATPATGEPTAVTETATTRTGTNDSGTPLWPLAAIAAVIVAIGAFFLLRRRKRDAYEEEVYYEEPVAAAVPVAETTPVLDRGPVAAPATAGIAPLAAAPMVAAAAPVADDRRSDELVTAGLAEDATVTDAPTEDVAALTEGAAPVRNRPWLEFAMRPVRAGTSADEALVEIELTVANSGSIAAQDVRVSTFMLTDAHASEMENMLVDAPADAAIAPVDIEPGEGTRIDATLAALKSDLGTEGRFTPVVVADARYRLPDGTEGRTSASFVVGVSDEEGGTLIPIDLADRVMRDDVEARLHGEPEHA